MALVKVYDAPTVFRALKGIINVFKPAGMTTKQVQTAIVYSMCRDLNELKVREPRKLSVPLLGTNTAADAFLHRISDADVDLSDHVLTTGPRYQMQDIRCVAVAGLGTHASGVLLFGINDGLRRTRLIQRNRPIRAYHITARLGYATESHFADSHTTISAGYHHVHPERVSALTSSMQASHQRKMYELCGVDLQSQAAYEIACKGPIRPVDNSQPVVYGIKLIDFQRPHFTLEIHCVNETETYLASLLHDMAIELRTVAHCSAIRCIRHAHFGVENALLRHHWNLRAIMRNLREQTAVLDNHPYLWKQNKIALRSS